MKTYEDKVQILKEYCEKILDNSYSPYSKIKVSCAFMDLEGKIFTGVNVENGSYGLTICAERNSIFAGVTNKFSGIDLMVILSNAKEVISPCGACRQVISEFTKDCPIVVFSQDKRYDYTLKELLPQGFSLN